jgi:hypothetical protein
MTTSRPRMTSLAIINNRLYTWGARGENLATDEDG